ncbi:MAG TPA: PAS domain S-box protein, partial [Tepidisphaeraceae bacterium]|nr:PAS domain S-box protein [Tepidisphaeraceae bacterium]
MQLTSKIAGDSHRAAIDTAPQIDALSPGTALLENPRDCDSPFYHAFTQAAVALAIIAFDGAFIQVNPALCQLLGCDEAELLAGDCFTVAHPDDAAESRAWFENLDPAQRRTFHFDRRFLHKSGREIHALLNISVARDAADEPLYFVAHIHDQTEQRRAQWMETDRRLALEMVAQDRPLPTVLHQLVQLIERQMPLMQACIMLLQDGTIRPFGENLPPELAAAIAKRPVSFSAGLTCTSIKHVPMPLVADVETHRAWDELRGEARTAGVKCCWGVTVRGGDGVPLGLVLVMVHERRSPSSAERDILETATRLAAISIEHHQTTRLLAHLVRHDPLTSLPNRVMFEDRLHQAMAAARRNNKPLGLLALDLNRFKQVNDTLG